MRITLSIRWPATLALAFVLVGAAGWYFRSSANPESGKVPSGASPVSQASTGLTQQQKNSTPATNGAQAVVSKWERLLPPAEQEKLTLDPNAKPNIFWIEPEDYPADRNLWRAFARLRLEKLQTIPPGELRSKRWQMAVRPYGKGVPQCRISHVPPGEHQQAKVEFSDDMDATLQFLEYLDVSNVTRPTAKAKAWSEREKLELHYFYGFYSLLDSYYPDVVLADALEGGNRYSERLRALVTASETLDGFILTNDLQRLMNQSPPDPDSEVGQWVAKELEAMQHAE